MIEMTVDDVLAQHEDELAGEERVILLREKDGGRLLPIWVGSPEGDALALHLRHASMLRPLTFDLAARLLEVAGARVERVVISRLHENVFYASVAVGSEEVDARPSDALNLAVRVGAPIYADKEVLSQAAFPAGNDVGAELRRKCEETFGPDAPGGDWQPLTPTGMRGFKAARGLPASGP